MEMSFKKLYPDYEKYTDGKLFYRNIPPLLVSALQGFIISFLDDAKQLKSVCNDIASRVPCATTQNWGWDYLLSDLTNLLESLSKKRLPKFMDFIFDFAVKHHTENEFLDDLNDIFTENHFGYCLKLNQSSILCWNLVEDPQLEDKSITCAVVEVSDICKQADAHLRQARENLQKEDNPRAWKDALRDCLSAMEALVNQLGGSTDIEKSTKTLRESEDWGLDIIVKDGLSIWKKMHELYPDIRHGNPKPSALTREEALYWIERLMAFVNYIARRKKILVRSQ